MRRLCSLVFALFVVSICEQASAQRPIPAGQAEDKLAPTPPPPPLPETREGREERARAVAKEIHDIERTALENRKNSIEFVEQTRAKQKAMMTRRDMAQKADAECSKLAADIVAAEQNLTLLRQQLLAVLKKNPEVAQAEKEFTEASERLQSFQKSNQALAERRRNLNEELDRLRKSLEEPAATPAPAPAPTAPAPPSSPDAAPAPGTAPDAKPSPAPAAP